MRLREDTEAVAETIRRIAEGKGWSNLTVLVEDKGDILFETQKALGKAGVVVTVTVDRFARRANSGQLLTGTLTVDVTASESIPVNRAKAGGATAQGVAEGIADALHWRELGGGFASPLRLASLEKAYPAAGVTSVALSFQAEYIL